MERNISFDEVVYEYYKDDAPYCKYSFADLKSDCLIEKKISGNDTDPQTKFKYASVEMNKDFGDILRIFGIEFYRDDLKRGSKYMFSEEDRDFLVELIHRYRQNTVWKSHIKKIKNYDEEKRSFVDLCKNSKCEEGIFQEIEFAINGFVKMYSGLQEVPEGKKQEFEATLHMYIQYPLLRWRHSMRQIIDTIPELSKDDLEESVGGILLEDYCKWLDKIRDNLLCNLRKEKEEWKETKKKRKSEYDDLINATDATPEEGEFLETLNKKTEEIYLKYEKKIAECKDKTRCRNLESYRTGEIRKLWVEMAKQNRKVAERVFGRMMVMQGDSFMGFE